MAMAHDSRDGWKYLTNSSDWPFPETWYHPGGEYRLVGVDRTAFWLRVEQPKKEAPRTTPKIREAA